MRSYRRYPARYKKCWEKVLVVLDGGAGLVFAACRLAGCWFRLAGLDMPWFL